MNRRDFLMTAAALPLAQNEKPRISLSAWSVHRTASQLELPRLARECGIGGVEFATSLWQAPTEEYIRRLKRYDVQPVLILCDGLGLMGHSNRGERMQAAYNHRQWVEIAAKLGCHAIRANLFADTHPSTPEDIDAFLSRCAESFSYLCGYARAHNLNVLIENHGGISSNPDVVVRLLKKLDIEHLGTLPDFGNFPKEIDRYEAVRKLMPYARGVSFKCYDFTEDGRESTLDMEKMMKVVAEAGYRGWVGIEYEGNRLPELDGVRAAKRCLDRLLS